MKIIVNAKEAEHSGLMTYEEVVKLSGKTGSPTVTYYSRSSTNRAGTMWPGCQPVPVEEGMVFNVMHTSNA